VILIFIYSMFSIFFYVWIFICRFYFQRQDRIDRIRWLYGCIKCNGPTQPSFGLLHVVLIAVIKPDP
jgi:hypothetical protein